MPDILQDLPIKAEPSRVFDAISAPNGLNEWWTETCSGSPAIGATYDLGFGPAYQWRATVSRWVPGSLFELTMTTADADWTGSRVGFELLPIAGGTRVKFHHRGWPQENDHFRTSCHCWAMYLRVLRRFLEYGERVPYAVRLDV